MPKRTNEFQQLITLIEGQLAPEGGNVYPSKMLKNRMTGKEREVDIIIESKVGSHPIVIGVECTSRGRKVGSEWVQSMIGKHQDLPVDKTILVSKSGFYEPAKELANKHYVETLTFAEGQDADWLRVVRQTKEVHMVNFLIPQIQKVTFVFNDPNYNVDKEELPYFDLLHSPDGKSEMKIQDYLEGILHSPEVIKEAEEKAWDNANTRIEFMIPLKVGVYVVRRNGQKLLVSSIRGIAICRKETSTIPLGRATYNTAHVAFGAGERFGSQIQVSFVEHPEKGATGGIIYSQT